MAAMRTIDEADMSPSLDVAIRDGLCRAFPEDAPAFSLARPWHGSFPAFSIVAEKDGRILAHVGVVDRTIRVGGVPVRSAGVQNVFVAPEARGSGLFGQVMGEAAREAMDRGFGVGLLFCVPALHKAYAALGWIDLGMRETLRIEDGMEHPLPAKNIAMFMPLGTPTFPDGPIHLLGNDW